jgi:hypothetical protein
MKIHCYALKAGALALLTPLLTGSLLADPTTIRIDASFAGAPTVQVLNSENYNQYVGPLVNVQQDEWGSLINLLGMDNVYTNGSWPPAGLITDREWRFTDPKAPDPARAAVFIVWIDHDYGDGINGFYGPFYSGDLRVGFNEKKPGHGYYRTVNAYPIQLNWVTLYADDTLVLQFKGFLPNPGQQ